MRPTHKDTVRRKRFTPLAGKFSNAEQLRVLSEWLIEQQIEEVVMESTAQYWKPVWGALEGYWKPAVSVRQGILGDMLAANENTTFFMHMMTLPPGGHFYCVITASIDFP